MKCNLNIEKAESVQQVFVSPPFLPFFLIRKVSFLYIFKVSWLFIFTKSADGLQLQSQLLFIFSKSADCSYLQNQLIIHISKGFPTSMKWHDFWTLKVCTANLASHLKRLWPPHCIGPIKVNQKITFFGSEIWKPGKWNISLG